MARSAACAIISGQRCIMRLASIPMPMRQAHVLYSCQDSPVALVIGFQDKWSATLYLLSGMACIVQVY
jgi:hypothetical protein